MELDDILACGSLDEVAFSRRGGRTSLDPNAATPAMQVEFERLIGPLRTRDFWNAAEEQSAYRPTQGLWAPQRRAVGLSLAHVAARRSGDAQYGAALVKMPTGTGKTGVIATLACAIPEIKRTLVITPRRALVDQMLRDLHTRFWSRFGEIYDGTGVRPRAGGDPDPDVAVRNAPVRRLLPSDAEALSQLAEPRIVMVGTFAALEQILRPERPAHRLSGRRPAEADAFPLDADEPPAPNDISREALSALLRSFDLVIVDESHYEPAFVWSQCIRSLGLPTILFSATPYRNDFRYFDIDGRFAFNLSFQEARDMRLVRGVRVIDQAQAAAPAEPFAERLIRFAAEVGVSAMPEAPAAARVIVRAESHDSLVRLREELHRLGHKSVLIHHRERRNDARTLRFNDAVAALNEPNAQDVRFWLHQWKLLEGVDDSRFCGVAILEPFLTSRAVVQQIGRVLRYQQQERDEVALVMGDGAVGTDMEHRFGRYLSYEKRFDADPAEALKRETSFFETLRNASPAVQYISGDFRDRLDIDEQQVSFADIQVPRRAFVTRWNGVLDLDQIAEASRSAMGLEDRHEATILSPGVDDPDNVRLIIYVSWGNSPLLTSKAMPTWNLGAMVIVRVRDRIFLLDTERLVVDPEAIGLEPEAPSALQKLVPNSSADEAWRVTTTSAVSLDLSDMGLRSMTARMRDFSTGFYDLAQGMQATTSVRALMKPTAGRSQSRYLSLQRATVSDARGGYVTLAEYEAWVLSLADRLESADTPSLAFSRFAQSVPAPGVDKALPQNILFDFAEIIGSEGDDLPEGWDAARTQTLAEADRCLDVDDHGNFEIVVDGQPFAGTIKYDVTGFVRRRGRYLIEIPQLDAHLIGRSPDDVRQREKAQLLSGLVSRQQSFRVVPADPSLVYAQRHFYHPSISIDVVARDEPGGPLENIYASRWMAHVTSEKGTGTSNVDDWARKSIFGGIYAQLGFADRGKPDTTKADAIRALDSDLAALLDEFAIVVCDDGGTETCDFICVDPSAARVVMIHAKVGKNQFSLNALQEVGRQAQASLGILTSIHGFPNRTATWRTRVTIKDGSLTRRVLKGGTIPKVWEVVHDALRSARYKREIWIFAGRILKRQTLLNRLKADPPTAKVRQMTYYLASLQTSAARANIAMRIYCSP